VLIAKVTTRIKRRVPAAGKEENEK
jgi:hypothetical protein